jgi:hypothetical protein
VKGIMSLIGPKRRLAASAAIRPESGVKPTCRGSSTDAFAANSDIPPGERRQWVGGEKLLCVVRMRSPLFFTSSG